MPTLLLGQPTVMTQNVVFTAPARACNIFSDTALQGSNDIAFATTVAIAALTVTSVASTFLRCTTANANVRVVAL
jgi:hypothetical protein